MKWVVRVIIDLTVCSICLAPGWIALKPYDVSMWPFLSVFFGGMAYQVYLLLVKERMRKNERHV